MNSTDASTADPSTPTATDLPDPQGPVPAPCPQGGHSPARPSSSAVSGGKADRVSVYDIITTKVLDLLERGTVPWRGGWTRSVVGAPSSLSTGKVYRGINRLLLAVVAEAASFTSPFWLTFRQAKELGGSIRKGEKGQPCVFWRVIDKTHDSEQEDPVEADTRQSSRKRFVLRYYTVFNATQCDGLPADISAPSSTSPTTPIASCEDVPAKYVNGPSVVHGVNRAAYSVSLDRVVMPSATTFAEPEAYYSTLFHELTHSTGHPDRLGRFSSSGVIPPFGLADYSREELVAEMGAAFLCAETGISCAVLENQAAYLDGWLSVLREDSKALVVAAAQAQRAVDLILGRQAYQESGAAQ